MVGVLHEDRENLGGVTSPQLVSGRSVQGQSHRQCKAPQLPSKGGHLVPSQWPFYLLILSPKMFSSSCSG